MKKQIKYLSLCGMLGYGYPPESLEKALESGIDFIGVDAGSTDPGPYYLGSGKPFVKDIQVKRDLAPAIKAAIEHKIPLIIGTAGGSGAKPHVDNFMKILRETAKENKIHFKTAVIYSDIEKNFIREALEQGRIKPCGPVPALTKEKIENLSNPVAQAGTEPLIKALELGVDVIVSGRCCDTAVFAALPIIKGFDPGLSLHCAKIAECGALCARPVGANDSLLCTVTEKDFTVEPLNPSKKCSPDSVAGHSLYEQPDPNCFYEPEGMIDMNNSAFEQISPRAVRVSGTVLRKAEKETLKLEGAGLKGCRTVTIGGISDPLALKKIDSIERGIREAVESNLEGIVKRDDYRLIFRRYGIDATLFNPLPETSLPSEAGFMIEVIAPDRKLSENILSLARSTALHQAFKGRKATAGNLAFPFSPSDLYGGEVYEFTLYHLIELEDEKLYNIEVVQI